MITEEQTKEIILSLITVTTKLSAYCDVIPLSLKEELDKLYLYQALLLSEKEVDKCL